MATTALKIMSDVRARIQDPAFPESELLTFCTNANRRPFNLHRTRLQQAMVTLTATPGTPQLPALPVDCQLVLDVKVVGGQRLHKASYEEIDGLMSTYSGDAQRYYAYGDTLSLFPTPTSAQQVQVRYLKKIKAITQNSDTFDVPEDFEELIFLDVLRQTYERRSRYDVAQLHGQQYEELLVSFLDRYATTAQGDDDPYVVM